MAGPEQAKAGMMIGDLVGGIGAGGFQSYRAAAQSGQNALKAAAQSVGFYGGAGDGPAGGLPAPERYGSPARHGGQRGSPAGQSNLYQFVGNSPTNATRPPTTLA